MSIRKRTAAGLIVAALCGAITNGVSFGETGAGASAAIPVDEAIRIALANNHDYQVAYLKLRESKERVNAAWGQLLPVIETEASMTRQGAESGFMSLSDGQYDIRFIQFRFGINPGVFYNSLRLSQNANRLAREEVRRVKAAVENTVIRSYFNLLLAEEMLSTRRQAYDLLKTNLQDVQQLFRTGSVPRYELLQAQVQLGSQEPLVMEAANNVEVAARTFNFNLGVKGVPYAADPAAILDARYALPRGEVQRKVEYLSRIALGNRPEVMQLERRREMTRNQKNLNASTYLWPIFSFGGSYGMTKYLPDQLTGLPPALAGSLTRITGTDEWQQTWQVRLAATYQWSNLLPIAQSHAGAREEKLRLKEADEELEKLKGLIGISIHAQYTKLITSYGTILSQKENVATAEEGMRIARESYRAGVIKNTDLLSAQFALTNARTSYIQAVYGYCTSLADLKREIGTDNERFIMEEVSQ